MKHSRKRRIFTVVDVWKGIAVGATSFTRPVNARKCLNRLRRLRNLDEDDVQLFESYLHLPPRKS
jgi:hypothetical protein